MQVHNVMEEIVTDRVNTLYEQVRGTDWLTCSCFRCKLDTCCYVLNRVPPQYLVSSQGVAHSENAENRQLLADIDALVLKGMKIVNESKRPFKNHEAYCMADTVREGPVFNFPAFLGSIYDGNTFEPLVNVEVLLRQEEDAALLIDSSWSNPYITTAGTPGAFTFWVKPEETETAGLQQSFHFSLQIGAPGYEPLTYFFDVSLTSEPAPRYAYNSASSLKLQDLYIFPKGTA